MSDAGDDFGGGAEESVHLSYYSSSVLTPSVQ